MTKYEATLGTTSSLLTQKSEKSVTTASSVASSAGKVLSRAKVPTSTKGSGNYIADSASATFAEASKRYSVAQPRSSVKRYAIK